MANLIPSSYYSAETDDDFRFVYIGERGTMTELHTDVCQHPYDFPCTYRNHLIG